MFSVICLIKQNVPYVQMDFKLMTVPISAHVADLSAAEMTLVWMVYVFRVFCVLKRVYNIVRRVIIRILSYVLNAWES